MYKNVKSGWDGNFLTQILPSEIESVDVSFFEIIFHFVIEFDPISGTVTTVDFNENIIISSSEPLFKGFSMNSELLIF